MSGLKRSAGAYLGTLLLPPLVGALSYPLIGAMGAALLSMALVWLCLGWGARGVKLGERINFRWVAMSVGVGALFSLLIIAVSQVALSLGMGTKSESVNGWAFVLVAVISLSAPWFEERFFRGVLNDQIEKVTSKAGSAVLTSALFALLHYPLTSTQIPFFTLGVLFILGLLMTFFKDKTKGLTAPIVSHLAFNATSLLFILWTF